MEHNRYVCPCLLGLEGLVADEASRNGGPGSGGAERARLFSGDASLLARANIGSRYAERVLVLLGQFPPAALRNCSRGRGFCPGKIGSANRTPFR